MPSAGPLGGLVVELEERYLAATPVNDANAAATASPAYALTNVRVGLDDVQLVGTRLSPFVGVTNLLDRDYNTSVTVNAFGRRYYEPGPGRSIYAGASLAVGVR